MAPQSQNAICLKLFDDGQEQVRKLEETLNSRVDALSTRDTPPTASQSENSDEASKANATTNADLTPVNAAFGKRIGHLLDGRKSVIGIIGSVITAVASSDGLDVAPIAEAAKKMLSITEAAAGPLLPVFIAPAAWGMLGKLEKMVRKNGSNG